MYIYAYIYICIYIYILLSKMIGVLQTNQGSSSIHASRS